MSHSWSDDDNLIAYYLYRFGDNGLPVTEKELSDILSMSPGSLSMKISNFRAIDGKGRLDRYSKQAVRIYERYRTLPDDQVRAAGEKAILQSMEKHISGLRMRGNSL